MTAITAVKMRLIPSINLGFILPTPLRRFYLA
jgi:hypothetical protein